MINYVSGLSAPITCL